MSDGGNYGGGVISFVAFVASVYVAFNMGQFLDWASSLDAPFSGLATVLVWAATVYGALGLLIIAIVLIVIALGGAAWVAETVTS